MLVTSSALAMPDGVCSDPEEGFFDYPIYIVTEFNDSRILPLSVSYHFTLKKYEQCSNGCQPLAEHNAYWRASDDLWFEVTSIEGKKLRWGCGGDVVCSEPVLAENVRCYVEKADCDAMYWDPYMHVKLLETFYLECRGDRSCTFEDRPTKDCCIVTGVKPWKT